MFSIIKNRTPYQYFWIILLAFLVGALLISCNGSVSTSQTSPAKALETALSVAWTKAAETEMAIPALTLTSTSLPSPSPFPLTETSVPITQSSPIPASGIPTTVGLDEGLTWMECVLRRRDYAYSTDMEFATDCLKMDQPYPDNNDKKLQGERVRGEVTDNLRLVIGNDIYETRYSRSSARTNYELLRNGEGIAKTSASFTSFDPKINLWNFGGKWVWEVANPFAIIVDGVNQNEDHQFEGSYFPYEIQHKLIYIAKKNGKYHVVYDEKIIGPEFDWIYLGNCCGYTKGLRGQDQYWFWGRREGTSFVVAIH